MVHKMCDKEKCRRKGKGMSDENEECTVRENGRPVGDWRRRSMKDVRGTLLPNMGCHELKGKGITARRSKSDQQGRPSVDNESWTTTKHVRGHKRELLEHDATD